MNESYPLSRTNKIRQLREKGSYDRETIHRVLDAGLVAHVAFVQDAAPVVVPMAVTATHCYCMVRGKRV